jgi:malonate-semialdehyde dehydrogenase (acetylating)/methylmalonate-semialdehyde dehydrogenase
MTEITELPVVPHWINGQEAPASGPRTAPVFDPAMGKETKQVGLAGVADIEAAVFSAV